jgi:hypothetical protein
MGSRGGIPFTAAVPALLAACSPAAPVASPSPSTKPVPSTTKPAPVSDAPALGPGPGSQPRTRQAATLVKDWTKECKEPATPIDGAPGTTRTCSMDGTNSGDVLVLVVKKSHGQTRL